jgi:tetratricopeptide (TPR) repeat protein
MKLSQNGSNQFENVGQGGGRKLAKLMGPCFLITVFIAILYINSLGNQFTNWDDGMIYQNHSIRNLSWEGIKKIFTLQRGNTYQPIRMLSYAIDYRIWELNPLGYHLTNILLYILTCIMIFFTLVQLSMGLREKASTDSHKRVALFGALLFAAHPVHVEAVTWLAARKEVLQGFFFFLAFFLYLKASQELRRKAIYLIFVILFVVFAILSKPSAVVFPGVIIIYEIARRKERLFSFLKSHWIFLSVSTVLSAVFIFILMKVMIEAGGIKPYRGDSFLSNILVSLYAFIYHLKLLILTINYSAAYSFSVAMPILRVKNILFTLLGLLLFTLAICSLRWTKVIFFSFFFFLIALLPYLNIIPISTLLADRYVFIASFSYVFLLGILFDRLYDFRQRMFSEGFFKLLSVVLFMFLLTSYSLMTIRQNKIWENSYTLWADAVEKHPHSNTANALLGVVYLDLGMDPEAIKHLEKAVELLPYDYQSRNNLGIVYGRSGEPEKALKELTTAILLRPDDDSIKINLSVFYQRQKEYNKAEKVLEYLLSKNPQNANLHYRIALVYKEAGEYEKAISELLKSIELAPHIINSYEELGNIFVSKFKDSEKAKYYYIQGINAAPKAKSRIEDLRWMIQDLECHQ